MRSSRCAAWMVVCALWMPASRVTAGTGDLDPTFGGDGTVTTAFPGGTFGAYRAFVQPDGRIIAVGSTQLDGNQEDFALARYLADGSLDPTFGTGGLVVQSVEDQDRAADAILQPDGRILVGGSRLARFEADGSLDTSFGVGGVVAEMADAMALQPDGKIVLVASLTLDVRVVRLLADGSYDLGFGTGGVVTVDPGAVFTRSLALQSDGGIVVAGTDQSEFMLVRFTSSGVLDATFGSGGIVLTSFPSFQRAEALAVQVQPDQRIVAAGVARVFVPQNPFANTDVALARYLPDGSLDPSFGTGGRVVTDGHPEASDQDYGADLLIEPDGRLVVSAHRRADYFADTDPALLRYLPDGSPDLTFGPNGQRYYVLGGDDWTFVWGLARQSDGKLVAVGGLGPYPPEFLVMRVDGACPAAPDGDGDGLGDACDPCTGGPMLSRVRLILKQQLAPPGDERLRLRGEVTLPPLDPVANGMRFLVLDAQGTPMIDAFLHPGPLDAMNEVGWTADATGTKFRYSNTGNVEDFPGGVSRVNLRRDATGRTVVKVQGRDANYTLTPADLPLTATLVFTPPRSATGFCAEAAFPGPTPSCAFNASGSTIKCR